HSLLAGPADSPTARARERISPGPLGCLVPEARGHTRQFCRNDFPGWRIRYPLLDPGSPAEVGVGLPCRPRHSPYYGAGLAADEQRVGGSPEIRPPCPLQRIVVVMSVLDKTTSRVFRAAFGLTLLWLAAAGCDRATSVSRSVAPARPSEAARPDAAYVGSASCRDCHEHFHELWATSRHGLAMQPYTPDFARRELSAQPTPVTIGARAYRALVGPDAGVVRATGAGGEKTYPIVHVLGGKNAYYFLTPLEKGRLQVLPVAYDVPKKTWYDTAASGVRHFPDRTDSALDWTDRMFTFNTTCFNCHVSQLATNYDLATDTYRTTWAEAGISCESCHGPAAGHVRVMSEGKTSGHTSKDIQIIRTKEFTAGQMNDMCATCHAKMV